MKHITPQEVEQLYERLTEPIIQALEAETTSSLVEDIGARNHLDRERLDTVRYLVASVLFGTLHPEDLSRTIAEQANLDKRIAAEVSTELHKRIFAPIAADLSKVHGFHVEGMPQPAPPTGTPVEPSNTAVQPQDQKVQVERGGLNPPASPPRITPDQTPPSAIAKPVPPESSQDTPLVIHEHQTSDQETKPNDSDYQGGLVRPTFYTPSNTAGSTPPPKARLQIGDEPTSSDPQTMRVGKEQARVVHYSAPEPQADPFSPTPKVEEPKAPEQPSTEKSAPVQPKEQNKVHPDNVVDLKDLPK